MKYYNTLMALATDLGYALSVSGAETYRVEESITHVLASYGISAEVSAVPNYLIVSILTDIGKPMTRMRRIGPHGNNLDAVEKLNKLSRRICSQHPEPDEAAAWLAETNASVLSYRFPVLLAGNFLGALGFALLFGCGWLDMLLSGLCGICVGFSNRYTDSRKVNFFFATILGGFCLALPAYLLNVAGIAGNVDGVVIGATMILVPGLIFTNAMRDIIYGDTNSGLNRLVQVFMIAAAIALGTAGAWNLVRALWQQPLSLPGNSYSLPLTSLGALIGCIGFSILFNIHGPGGLLCAFGGVFTWMIYVIIAQWTGDELAGYFWGSVFASAYSEAMARLRKYPTISYLVVSLFPLIPGAGIYYTMSYAVHGNMEAFAAKGTSTAAIAGIMAVGVMLVSTIVRLLKFTATPKHV